MIDPAHPAEALWHHLLGGVMAQAIAVAAELDIAEHIGDGDLDIEELAFGSGAIPERLYRILRLLASQGIFRETAPHRFANSPVSEALRVGHSDSQRDFAIYVGKLLQPGISELLHAVTTDEPSFDHVFGARLFDYLSRHPEEGLVFTRAMASAARLRGALADSYDWPDTGTIVDVGGADGATLTRVLRARPRLHGVVLDLPHLATAARRTFDATGVADRCRFVAGDFFDEVWTGGDIYLLSSVIHDWGDASALKILANCRRSIAADGRLLILDSVLTRSGEWHPGKMLDVVMLAMTAGRERTEPEWKGLLEQAGLVITSITHSQRVSLIEAKPA